MKTPIRIAAVVGALALTLSACSTGAPAPANTGAAPTGGAATTGAAPGADNKKISFVAGVAGDEFYITMECGIREEAEKLGYTVDIQAPTKFDPTLQRPIIDSVLAAAPAGLLVAPTDVTALQQPLERVAAAGIKVALVDTTTNDPSFAVSAIASDNEGGGKAAFEAVKAAKPQGGKVLVISTDPGVSTLDARVKGFADAAGADSAFSYLGVQYSHNDPATAARLVTAALQKDPDIVGIFAGNLFAAEGTATGIRQAGAKDIIIVGFDAGPNQVKALQEGTVQALVAQSPAEIGSHGVKAIDAAIKGQTYEKAIQTGFTVITADNLAGEGGKAVYKSSC